MIPEDMMAALGGPAAGPMGGPEAIPPEMLAMLGGGGEEPELPGIMDGSPGGGEDHLVQAIDHLQMAIDSEADQEDIQVMLQCQTKLQQVLAKNQSEADGMAQGKMSPRGLRKATAQAY